MHDVHELVWCIESYLERGESLVISFRPLPSGRSSNEWYAGIEETDKFGPRASAYGSSMRQVLEDLLELLRKVGK